MIKVVSVWVEVFCYRVMDFELEGMDKSLCSNFLLITGTPKVYLPFISSSDAFSDWELIGSWEVFSIRRQLWIMKTFILSWNSSVPSKGSRSILRSKEWLAALRLNVLKDFVSDFFRQIQKKGGKYIHIY